LKAEDTWFLNLFGGVSRQFGLPVFQRQDSWTHTQSSQWFGDVQPLAETLSEQLAENNIRAFPCRDGTTRAATYLGMTCDGSLPTALEPLRPMSAAQWMPT
jgi:hypothetical protein